MCLHVYLVESFYIFVSEKVISVYDISGVNFVVE